MATGTLSMKAQLDVTQVVGASKIMNRHMNRTVRTFFAVADAAGKTAGAFTQVTGAFTGMLIARRVTRGLIGMVGAAAKMQRQLQNIKAITPGVTAGLENMRTTILTVAADTGIAFETVGETIRTLLTQSLPPGAIDQLIGPLTKLQRVGNVTADQSARLVVALTNMGVRTDQVSDALDVMQSLATKSALQTKDFIDVLIKAGPAANAMNVSFTQLAQTTAILRAGFASGAEEGTALTQALLALSNPQKRKKLQEAFNLDTIDPFTSQIKNLPALFDELAQGIKRNAIDQGELGAIFGVRTGGRVLLRGITALADGMNFMGVEALKSTELLDALNSATISAKGTVDAQFNVAMQTMGDQLRRVQQALEGFLIIMGGPFVQRLTEGLTTVANIISGLREFMEANIAVEVFMSGLFQVAFLLGATLAAMLLFAGSAIFLRFGIGFVNKEMGIFSTTTGFAATKADIAASRFGRLGIVFRGLKGTVLLLRASFAALFKAMLGPLGLIILLFEVLPLIFGLFRGGKEKSSKVEVINLEMDAATIQANAAKVMGQASQVFLKAAFKFAGGIVKKGAIFTEKQLEQTFAALDLIATQPIPFVTAGKKEDVISDEEINKIRAIVLEFAERKQKGTLFEKPELQAQLAASLQTVASLTTIFADIGVPGAKRLAAPGAAAGGILENLGRADQQANINLTRRTGATRSGNIGGTGTTGAFNDVSFQGITRFNLYKSGGIDPRSGKPFAPGEQQRLRAELSRRSGRPIMIEITLGAGRFPAILKEENARAATTEAIPDTGNISSALR